MTYATFFKPAVLALFSILAFGCNKSHDDTRVNASSAADALAIAEVITEFSSLETNAWVNGSPVSLTESRAKHVVLIEAWHPS